MGYDIIVIAGQSNAEGFGYGEVECSFSENEKIMQLYDRQAVAVVSKDGKAFLDISEPFNLTFAPERERVVRKRTFGCLADSFAEEYIKAGYLFDERKVLIIKAAVGGTGFARHEWGIDSILHKRLLEMLDLALSESGSRICAFLWHQGEHDAVELPELNAEQRYKKHRSDLGLMLKDLRFRYGEEFPFIAGGFCDEWYFENRSICDPVISAIKAALSEFNNTAFVESDGLVSNNFEHSDGDGIHFSRSSLYKLGVRYFEKYRELIK